MREAVLTTAYPPARRAAEVRPAAVMSSNGPIGVDREELEQEAMVGILLALPQVESSRASLRTLVERVVAAKIVSALRALRIVLRVPTFDAPPLSLGQPTAAVELRSHVRRVLAVLSGGDRRLAPLLAEHTPTEASRKLPVSRSIVDGGIHQIRIAFVGVGLGLDGTSRS
jgi:DNA-directed RNA polymerase specialized sigma24 family protein